MRTRPESGRARPTSMRIVVVLPAPLGPRKPKTSPARTANDTPDTAVRFPKCLVSPSAERTTSRSACRRESAASPSAIAKDVSSPLVMPLRASRLWLWTLPRVVGLAAAAVFATGLVRALRGSVGEPHSSAPAAAATPVPRRAHGDMARILVIGDSLARGTGDESGRGFAVDVLEAFRRRGKAELTNLGVNGLESGEIRTTAESSNVRNLAADAALILVSAGGNDLSHAAAGASRSP